MGRMMANHDWWSSRGKRNTGEHWWGGACWWGMIGVVEGRLGWGVDRWRPMHLVAKVLVGQAPSISFY